MTSKIALIAIVLCLCLAAVLDTCTAGGKGGSNIILHDKHSKIILNEGGKKGGDNIIIKDHKSCCHKKVKYVYVPVPMHHEHHGHGHGHGHHGWGEHGGWGHENNWGWGW